MEYHEVDCVGRFWIEEVNSLPTWHPSYDRRVIKYNGALWYGNSNEWQRINTGQPEDYISAKFADVHAGTITPSADNIIDHGASDKRYANIYAVNFQGTATTATYADLAEKYTTKFEYSIGTVLQVSRNEEYDLEPSIFGGPYAGVVSENPAFLMNAKCDGQIIALIGKTPVRIIGKIHKGDPIMPTHNGFAIKIENQYYDKFKIGYSLETNPNEKEKLIMCMLRR